MTGYRERQGLWVLSVLLLMVPGSLGTPPPSCQTLQVLVPDCACEASVEDAALPTLNCKGKGLTSVPTINGSFTGLVRHFTLANNDITNLTSDAFRGLRIFHLDITGNKISNVSDTAFQGLEGSLEELQLGGDPASPIQAPWTAVKLLVNLKKLELDNFRVPGDQLNGSDILTAFASLTHLKVDSFNLALIYPDFFTPRRQTLKSVEFHNNQFQTLPVAALQELLQVEVLKMTQNFIQDVTYQAFGQMTKLKELDLSNNKINILEDSCFHGVENVLEILNLERNSFRTSAELDRIRDLRVLKTLRLGINSLNALPIRPTFLENKSGLQNLQLNRNSLRSLPSGAFDSVQGQLLELNLGYNQINSTTPDAFRNLTKLQKLNLEQQTIGNPLVLPSFSALTSLRELMLSGTKFDSSGWSQISKLSTLTTLVLSGTNLSVIPDHVLGQMSGLQELHLDNNRFSSLSQAALYGPRHSLRYLSLANNRLSGLSRCVLIDFNSTVTLSLLDNPLHCNCTLRWLVRALQSGSVTLESGLETCVSPPSLANQRFSSQGEQDLPCDDNQVEPVPPCDDLYTTTPTTVPTTTPASTVPTLPTVTITVSVTRVNQQSMTVNWQVGDGTYIDRFYLEYTELSSGLKTSSERLPKGSRFYNILNLSPGQNYQICVQAVKTDGVVQHHCITSRTQSPPTTPTPQGQKQGGDDLPMIISLAVIGSLVLILLVIVLYLFFASKKKGKKDLPQEPIQPRVFARSELPTMGYDSKRFQRPKKKKQENNNVKPEDIQINVISDGKDAGTSNLSRVSAGSYQALDENAKVQSQPSKPPRHTYVNEGGAYANDSDLRPLPRVPRDYRHGGYEGQTNPGFRHSGPKDERGPPSYQEIVL